MFLLILLFLNFSTIVSSDTETKTSYTSLPRTASESGFDHSGSSSPKSVHSVSLSSSSSEESFYTPTSKNNESQSFDFSTPKRTFFDVKPLNLNQKNVFDLLSKDQKKSFFSEAYNIMQKENDERDDVLHCCENSNHLCFKNYINDWSLKNKLRLDTTNLCLCNISQYYYQMEQEVKDFDYTYTSIISLFDDLCQELLKNSDSDKFREFFDDQQYLTMMIVCRNHNHNLFKNAIKSWSSKYNIKIDDETCVCKLFQQIFSDVTVDINYVKTDTKKKKSCCPCVIL